MRSRRNTELWLLIAAAPVLFLLFMMLLVNDGTQLTVEAFAVPIALIAAFFVAHILLRFFAKDADPGILPIVFALTGIGVCFILRLVPDEAMGQIIWLFLGIALMAVTIIVVPSIEKLRHYRYVLLLVAIILLLLPLAPFIGHEEYGSKLWISIAGKTFQPGELAKVCIILFLASYLATHREMLSTFHKTRHGLRYPDFKTALPLVGMWIVAMIIVVLEKDLGSALLLYAIFLAMVYICTGRISYVILGVVLLAAGGTALYHLFDHVQLRIALWLNPFETDSTGALVNSQIPNSLFSLADGGLFGKGIGRGLPNLVYVVESDFIFSAIGEEMGLLGASGVIILYLLLAVRAFATAARAKSDVSAFTAAGIGASFSLQAFIIIGGVTGLIPLTGITLPFISKGGSSVVASFIMIGLLLRSGNEGTGLSTELTGTMQVNSVKAALNENGVLGRSSLGKRLTKTIAFIAILFALLIARLTYVQIIEADSLQKNAYNTHTTKRLASHQRGEIRSSDGVVLAKSEKADDGTYVRVYPHKTLATHLVGYYSLQRSAGVEKSMSESLVGEQDYDSISDIVRSAAGLDNPGNDVVLTINSKVQKKAQQVLKGNVGACVVLDTETGATLAQASSPTFNLNEADGVNEGTVKAKDGCLINRATDVTYEPGSTFKTVTLAAALDTGFATADTEVDSPSSLEIGGAKVTTHQNSGTITLKQAMAISSNTAFAQLAVDMGGDTLEEYAKKFGLNSSIAQDFYCVESKFPKASDLTTHQLAWAGAGEDQTGDGPEVTVTQMATIMAAISNGGEAMKPYVIEKVESSTGNVIKTTSAKSLGKVMSASAAVEEQDIMRSVVTSGTGTAAQISDADVIGKTGTAESGDHNTAWFIATATRNGKSVTVALVIENTTEEGGTIAAPKAREVLEAALEAQGA